MKKILLIIFLIFWISSCFKQELILDDELLINGEQIDVLNEDDFNNNKQHKNEKVFTVIPHHNLVNTEIDIYYQSLKEKYNDFDNIVIISPNHFYNKYFTPTKTGKNCYELSKQDCVNINILGNLEMEENIESFNEKDWYIETKEHWIANHFQFINKYFKNSKIYSVLLKINTKKDDNLLKLEEYLNNYDFIWKTLFIASVDFSHHVNEKIAVFHDLSTIDFLNSWNDKKLEVDCPNCLYLIKDLSNLENKNYFNVFHRTSVDNYLNINSNYNNTTHIYWEFENETNFNLEKAFSWTYLYSKFDKTSSWTINQNEIFWMFFWDIHFTRWFTDYYNSNTIEDYLSCFYSNNDLLRTPELWHNRFFYWFDFVWVNLETSVWTKNECQYSQKEIVLQTAPEYLDYFKNVWINLYNLANNHSYDCWEIWYTATKKYLDEKWLYYFWDWRKTEENIFKKEINWTKVAFVWFNDIWNQIDISSKSEKIKNLTAEGYIVIVNVHWGYEYALHSNERQQKIAKEFVDSWAKLIIWHHPHVIQEYEIYLWIPIFYSLWNFLFDQPFENTLKWYWIIYAINWEWIKYNILEFNRNFKNYRFNCDEFE